ncbi:MAG: acyclic terpene utilization AtuA family protein, partial [Acidobacteriota bacterium]
MKTIRIGGALGYWGDRSDAILDLLNGGPLDYVIMDYLAEVTMSILRKQAS